jgi:hypothetical protein
MEILIGRHVVIRITCSKVTCNPTKVAYFSRVYYRTLFENYVVYEAVMVSLPPQNGSLVADCGVTSIPIVAEIGQLVRKSRGKSSPYNMPRRPRGGVDV